MKRLRTEVVEELALPPQQGVARGSAKGNRLCSRAPRSRLAAPQHLNGGLDVNYRINEEEGEAREKERGSEGQNMIVGSIRERERWRHVESFGLALFDLLLLFPTLLLFLLPCFGVIPGFLLPHQLIFDCVYAS